MVRPKLYTKEDVEAALRYKDTHNLTFRELQERFGIPKSTLSDAWQGRKTLQW